jgi:hypothetical protein
LRGGSTTTGIDGGGIESTWKKRGLTFFTSSGGRFGAVAFAGGRGSEALSGAASAPLPPDHGGGADIGASTTPRSSSETASVALV